MISLKRAEGDMTPTQIDGTLLVLVLEKHHRSAACYHSPFLLNVERQCSDSYHKRPMLHHPESTPPSLFGVPLLPSGGRPLANTSACWNHDPRCAMRQLHHFRPPHGSNNDDQHHPCAPTKRNRRGSWPIALTNHVHLTSWAPSKWIALVLCRPQRDQQGRGLWRGTGIKTVCEWFK